LRRPGVRAALAHRGPAHGVVQAADHQRRGADQPGRRTADAVPRSRPPHHATADYLHLYFEPTARAIDGLEKALAGLGLLDDALALDLRKPQDYFHRVWSTAFRAADLADAGRDEADRDDTPADEQESA
jgi:hypothetical protein